MAVVQYTFTHKQYVEQRNLTTLVGRLLFHAGRTHRQAGRQAGRQIDRQRMKKLMVAFRNSSKAHKMSKYTYNFICVFFYTFFVTKNVLAMTVKKLFKNALQNSD